MAWQYAPYMIPLILAGAISGMLAVYLWKRRSSTGAGTIGWLMLALTIWSLAYAVQLSCATLPAQVFWGKVQYFGIVLTPVTWLIFAIQYTNRGHWLTRQRLTLFFIEPVVTLAMAWTNDRHGLIWSSSRLETIHFYSWTSSGLEIANTFGVKVSSHGAWFWVHMAYSYALLLVGTILIFGALMRSRHLYRAQTIALLIFGLTPWIGNALYLSGLNPFPYLDLTPFAFTLAGPVLAFALYRFRLADLVPIAHASVIENMNDGMIMLDAQNRILDLNPAAERAIARSATEAVGRPLDEVLSDWPDCLDFFRKEAAETTEILLGDGNALHTYDARLFPLCDRQGHLLSKVISLRDITERKQTDNELNKHREQLEEMVRERTAEVMSINEQLRLSELRYSRVLDASHDMLCVYGENAEILYVNKGWKDNALYTVEETEEVGLFNTVHPDDREWLMSVFQRAKNGERFRSVEYRVIGKNGEVKWREGSGGIIDWPGTPTAVLDATRDITERKQLEEKLRLSEERYSCMMDSSHDMALVADDAARLLFANKAHYEQSGYSIDEANQIGILNLVHPDDRQRMREHFQRVMAGEPIRNVEYRRINKNGDVRWVESNADPMQWPGAEKAAMNVLRDITDRKQAEEALRISKERYRNIFEEAPDIFYLLDLETWKITEANKCALDALEYGLEQIGNIHVSEILHPDDYEKATSRLVEMVINKDRMPNFPLRILTRTGKELQIEQSGVIFWDEAGRAKSFLGLAHDVTLRKKQEEMIRKRNEKLAALYEIARIANESLALTTVFDLIAELVPRITNSDGVSVYVFDEATQCLHYRAQRGLPEHFIRGTNGLKLGEGLHGRVAQSREAMIVNNLLEHPMLAGREHVREFDHALIVPLMARGRLLGTLTVVRKPGNPYDAEDLDLMTAFGNQIAVAMENARLYARVLQRETHLQSILETSRDGIVVTSKQQRVVYRNSELSRMFGYDESDDLTSVNTISFFAPDSYPTLQWIRDKLERGEQINEIVEWKGKRKDGTTFDAEMRIGFFFENGERYDVGIVRDMTDRKRMEYQLQQTSKLAAIGELAAGVAHEINNPVATIHVQTGLMKDIIEDEQKHPDAAFHDSLNKCLRTIEEQVQRCRGITGNLLSFSRSPEGESQIFGINELLRRAKEFVVQLTDKRPTVKMLLDEKIPPFRGDPNRLEQVFVNLMANAIRAIPPLGEISVVSGLAPGGDIRIEFKDSGPGIPREIKGRIFDPFFTTRPAGEGTGLGLSISHYIIKEMNGKLEADSQPGQGAVFTVTLPPADE